jgi:hypothetical protein
MLARRLARVFCGLAIASASCSVPEFDFKGTGQDAGIPVEHCTNTLLDGDQGETDLNCGGPCPPCASGQACAVTLDCASGECIEGTCRDPLCSDGVVSGDESGIDCGGSCTPCPDGGPCNVASDCASSVCGDNGMCAVPSCSDDAKNGSESDVDCGGTTCDKCPTGGICVGRNDCISAECTNGKCTVVCLDGTGNCDGDMANGCETNLKTSAAHCNACGAACNLPNAEEACSAGECVVDSCVAPYLDCNGEAEDGCEVNGSTDGSNCGGCGITCIGINGSPFCAGSACQITCDTGYGDCNDDRADGCEANIHSVAHCGECNNACDAGNGTPQCNADDMCVVVDCDPGRGDCNLDSGDGCEMDVTADVDNCGGCGNICVVANGTAGCEASECMVESCNPGRADCDGVYTNGCEVNLNNDPDNCGSCDNVCNIANASNTCETGMCRVLTCTPPFADCNADRTSCETNTSNNATNCGGCGMNGLNCTTTFSHASGTCQSSMCVIGACSGNWLNCNTQPIDGCEVDRQENDNHCGGCNQPCVDLNANNHCDLCACVAECNANFLSCDSNSMNGCEVNALENDNHCGMCGEVCQEINTTDPPGTDDGNSCNGGVCVVTCNASSLSCDMDPSDGCEIDKTADESNCGACGTVCLDNATSHTASNNCGGAGVCNPVCDSGWDDCDSSRTNGCELQVSNDPNNCGACDVVCSAVHGTNSCTNSSCVPSCDTGWAACGSAQAGCSTALGTTSNCASCGNSCPAFCSGAPGSASCQPDLDIVFVNSVTQIGTGGTGTYAVNFTHALQSGPNTYRVILIAVAADGNTAPVAKPETVTYGGIAGVLAREEFTSRAWAGIYSVVIPQAQAAGNNTVIVSNSEFGVIVNVVEFRGVDRMTPVEANGGGLNAQCSSDDPSDSVTTISPDSWLFSVVSMFNWQMPVGSPGAGQTETLDAGISSMGAIGGYKPNVAVGVNTMTWDVTLCDRGAHVVVALEPADAI